MVSAKQPAVPLTRYLRLWVLDKSRFKIGCFTRQGGKTFGTALEAVIDCEENPNTLWVFLSAGERQSAELIGKAKMHARAIGAAFEALDGEYRVDKDTVYKRLEIIFPNGSGEPGHGARLVGEYSAG